MNEYQASSQPSSQPASQPASRPTSPSGRNSAKKQKKLPFSKKGDRPGRIVQPAGNARFEGNGGLLEPLAPAGSQLGDTSLVSQCPVGNSIEVVCISREEAFCHVEAHLGADVSHLSDKMIKALLEEITESEQVAGTGPMDVEGGSAP
ncbi:hypothetical protein FRC10_004962, partial [Ceratobasidium sp. 414]